MRVKNLHHLLEVKMLLEEDGGGIRRIILEEKERGRRTRSLAAIKLIKMAFVLQAAYSAAR